MKVAWIKVSNMDIIAIGDYKVTNDDRIKLLHGYVTDWSLSIQPVNEEDAGEYICQINTEPQMITRINLQVLCMKQKLNHQDQLIFVYCKQSLFFQVPPKINEERSTINPGTVQEGHTLKLHCHSEGSPTPRVSWYFRRRVNSHHSHSVHHPSYERQLPKYDQIVHEGETLVIHNVSRSYSGIFECLANNSVPPAASRKIKVSVECNLKLNRIKEV